MVGRRKKRTKICDKVSHEEDRISQLPDHLTSEILCHLSTKDAIRTSVLSTKWRNLWQCVPGLDFDSSTYLSFDAFVSFVERCFITHKIRKLRFNFYYPYRMDDLTSWIDVVTTRRIQHFDVDFHRSVEKIPQSIYTCETLVHLGLSDTALANAEFVSLPCMKILQLEYVRNVNESTLQKLISGSPVLEDFMIIRYSSDDTIVLQLSSHTLKRIAIR